MAGGEKVIHHARVLDRFGRWYGLVKIGIEAERRYPSIETWRQVLKDKTLVLHHYDFRPGEHSFGGRLWIWYKEAI